MECLSEFGKAIVATDQDKIRLDKAVKNILAYKPLLARIFKEVVSECHEMSYDEIEVCIEGDVLIGKVYVDSGLTNAGERIAGLSTEAYINDEGLDRFDIRTYLRLPGYRDAECIKLIINVEAQNDDKPGYDIPIRALFYCCRMISAQQGVEFTTDSSDQVKYGNIKKVYSIWVCTEAAQTRANSIELYDINRQFLFGSNADRPRYDILNAIIIYISAKHDSKNAGNELIKLLTDLFDERINGAEKVKRLKSVYGLNMTKEVESEVNQMCTYATAMENKGIEKGEKIGIEKGEKIGVEKGIIEGKRTFVADMLRSGRNPQEIADFCHISLDYVLEIQKSLVEEDKN